MELDAGLANTIIHSVLPAPNRLWLLNVVREAER